MEEDMDSKVVPEQYDIKKKRKKRTGKICTSQCKFSIVREVAKKLGMKDVIEEGEWNVFWTDNSISMDQVKKMRKYQKINHFPGMEEICRKDLLAKNLNRMFRLFPNDYKIFPKTWSLPFDYAAILKYMKNQKRKTLILKPGSGCRGQGIQLVISPKEINPFKKFICQVYIPQPFLINGYKFDIRVYALISSCNPLRIYVYNEGLVRFATSHYKLPSQINITNMYMHLTNYSVNKFSRTFVQDGEEASKRKISSLNNWFREKSYNVDKIWNEIDDVIIKTIIAAYPTLRNYYKASFHYHLYNEACFELLGFDIILNKNLKPFILEVNHSPSLHTDSEIDKEVKESLVVDTFKILNLTHCEKRKMELEDKKLINGRLLMSGSKNEYIYLDQESIREAKNAKIMWEEANKGNFRKVYPSNTSEKYRHFFCQTQGAKAEEKPSSITEKSN